MKEVLKKQSIHIVCSSCRRNLAQTSKDTLGIVEIVCTNNRCRIKNSFLIYFGKIVVIDKSILKKKHVLNSLPEELKKIIMEEVN